MPLLEITQSRQITATIRLDERLPLRWISMRHSSTRRPMR
jgi:hypothetical protein